MNENQPAPVTRKDILDIIKIVRPLKSSQKQDIIVAIDTIKAAHSVGQDTNVQ